MNIKLPSLTLFAASILCGCGGGSGGSGGTLITGASFQIMWPSRSRAVFASPLTSAQSVLVTLKGADGHGGSLTMAIDRDPTRPGGYTGAYTFSQPVASSVRALTATFYAQTSEQGAIVGTANAVVNLTGTSLNIASINIVGAIQKLTVVTQSIQMGNGLAQLAFAATDKNGNAVAVTPGSAKWSVPTGSNLTLTSDGLALGVSTGSASVTASVDGIASSATPITVTPASFVFEKGADVGWVTQEESTGLTFKTSSGTVQDCFKVLKGIGVSCVRLRMWVNPTGGWCGEADTLAKARRAVAAGQRIMIDFHYSDTWADPGTQTPPAAWKNDSISQLESDLYAYTQSTLAYLKTNGIPVSYVQVGNELTNGMLWPLGQVSPGSSSNFVQLTGLINQGYAATKSVYPDAKVIVHLSSGNDNNLFRWFFDNLQANAGQWDIVGMTFYPGSYGTPNDDVALAANQKDMVSRYSKPVCVCEIGYAWDQGAAANTIISKVVADTQSLGPNGIGVFYWEPESYPNWQSYTLGACDATGQFTAAMSSL